MSAALFFAALGLQLAGGLAGLLLSHRPRLALRAGALGAVAGGLVGVGLALAVLTGTPFLSIDLPWPVPGGTLSLGVDALSAVFLVPVFGLSALFAVYGVGYLDAQTGKRWLGGQVFFYNLLAASMAVVVAARDGVLFLVAWEVMSLASFFLVAFENDRPEVGAASRLYLIAAHLGAGFLLVFFALWEHTTGSFALVRQAAGALGPGAPATLFALALVGFGTKAGLWPLHVWLPKAHPAAPSHVSALMSGVMLKVGVYGVCRTLWLLGTVTRTWAVVLLLCGAVSALLGILGALGQRDLKALLAYSSGENVGVIFLGLGVGALGSAAGQPVVAAAGYAGAFLHTWNHGLFKGLLFLGAGNVLHATRTRTLEQLGGLARSMPWTAAAFGLGAAAIAGLPPLNGLVSEWLIYGALFRAGVHLPGAAGLLGLGAAAVLALVGGLALATFAKAMGTVFLGEPRTADAAHAHEAGPWLLAPMGVLAAGCLAVGLAPSLATGLLGRAVGVLDPGAHAALAEVTAWTGPLAQVGRVSAALLVLTLGVVALRNHLLKRRAVASSPTWGCGYAAPTASMQYTGSSFSDPVTALFRPVLRSTEHLEPPRGFFPAAATFATRTPDLAEHALWAPLFCVAARGLATLRFLQGGRLQHYLLFLLLTLLVLLGWALVPL
ncbi:MAG TPA: proton-conducting transporter membrane subunit [Deferrisomatales bacterium]|nr:proton-conducting transporter membrane subunit [Deferrisomatales bacterium]